MRDKAVQLSVAAAILALLASGCALGRDVLDVRVQPIRSNPQTGKAVKIVRVTDKRVFSEKPATHSSPSLKDSKEITDRAITLRAIARKSGTYGNQIGDIVLPEGRTVEMLVNEALIAALREAGLRVLVNGEPGYDEAIPIEADIEKFWCWFTPGFWDDSAGVRGEASNYWRSAALPARRCHLGGGGSRRRRGHAKRLDGNVSSRFGGIDQECSRSDRGKFAIVLRVSNTLNPPAGPQRSRCC